MPSGADRTAIINDLAVAIADRTAEAFGQALQPLIQGQDEDRRAAELSRRSVQESSDSSDSQGKQHQKDNAGLLKSIVQNISLPLPGGARLFGLSSFMDKLDVSQKKFKKGQKDIAKAAAGTTEKQQAQWENIKERAANIRKNISAAAADEFLKENKDMDPENIQEGMDKKAKGAMSKRMFALQAFTIAVTAAGVAITVVTEGLRVLGKSLGGVSEGQAFSALMGSIQQSITGLAEGRIRSPVRTLQMQGSAGQEFGQLISSKDAAIMSDVVTDFGITTNQMAKLERTFQSTAMGSREALQSFAEVGILGQTAATELAANAGAVARAGDNFNEFIRDGIKHAKQLGLEFSKMESTLTGFTMDFEGTVSSFSELRAVIPGMATNFGQLLSTAMSGSTDEYIDQIRSSLLGAGIGSATDLNRQQAALLEKATGFSSDQIDRILAGESLNAETEQDLTKKTNWLMVIQLGLLGGILGVLGYVLSIISGGTAAWWGAIGMTAGVTAGAAVVTGGFGMLDDAYITKDGKTIPFSEDDNILLTKSDLGRDAQTGRLEKQKSIVAQLGRPEMQKSRDAGSEMQKSRDAAPEMQKSRVAQMDRLEMQKQTQAINNLVRVMSGPQTINLKNWREAERSAMDASIREA